MPQEPRYRIARRRPGRRCAQHRQYNLLAMPVVSDDQRSLGIVTVDDALDVEEEHAKTCRLPEAAPMATAERSRRHLVFIATSGSSSGLSQRAPHRLRASSSIQTLLQRWCFACLAMPVALILAVTPSATNFFLEDDPGSEDSSILALVSLTALGPSGCATAALGAGLSTRL